MKRKIVEIPDMIPGARENRNWKNQTDDFNDLTELLYQIAVFNKSDNKIYKLNCLDYRGKRFDVSDHKMTKYIRFNDAILFNFTVVEEFEKYYINGASTMSKAKIFEWLSESTGRVSVGTLDGPK